MIAHCRLLILLALPVATASGTVDLGIASVVIHNGHHSDCVDGVTDLCLASSEPDGAFNLSQNITFVGIRFQEPTPLSLLPDDAIIIRPSDWSIPFPVFRVLIDHVGNRSAPAPAGDWGVGFTEERMGFTYFGPGLNPIDPTPKGGHGFSTRYGDEGREEGLVERDRIRPSQDYGTTSTHERADEVGEIACYLEDQGVCASEVQQLSADAKTAAPDVIIGLRLVGAAVNGEPADLGDPTLGARSEVAEPLGARQMERLPTTKSRESPFQPLDVSGHGVRILSPRESPRDQGPRQAGLVVGTPLGPEPVPLGPRFAIATGAAATFLALAVALLYARIHRRDEALRSERRQRLMDIVAARGPQTIAALSRELALDRTTVEHHARVLHRTGQTTLLRANKFVYVAMPGQSLSDVPEPMRPTQAKLLQVLAERGGQATRADLAALTPTMAQRSRNHALGELVKRGTLRVDYDGYTQTIRLALGAEGSSGHSPA